MNVLRQARAYKTIRHKSYYPGGVDLPQGLEDGGLRDRPASRLAPLLPPHVAPPPTALSPGRLAARSDPEALARLRRLDALVRG